MDSPLRKGKNKSNNLSKGSLVKYKNKSRNPFNGPYKKEVFAISLAILTALLVLLLAHSLTEGSNIPVQQPPQPVINQTPEIPTQNYAAGGISFQYPTSWNITTNQLNETSMQLLIQDPASANNPQTTQVTAFYIAVEKNPSDTLEQKKDMVIQSLTNNGANIAPSNTTNITVNGISATETLYNGNDANYNEIQLKVIYFEQNGVFYILTFFTKGIDLQSQNIYFNIILNSFKIQ